MTLRILALIFVLSFSQASFARDGQCSVVGSGFECSTFTYIYTEFSTQVFIAKLHSQKKFFAHHSLYHAFVLDMEKLAEIESLDERFVTLSEILDPENKYMSLKEALNENLEEIGLNGAEIMHLTSILDSDTDNGGQKDNKDSDEE